MDVKFPGMGSAQPYVVQGCPDAASLTVQVMGRCRIADTYVWGLTCATTALPLALGCPCQEDNPVQVNLPHTRHPTTLPFVSNAGLAANSSRC